MATIQITPENVTRAGKDIQAKKQEIIDIISRARTLMTSLRGEFKGNLADQIFANWDGLQGEINKSFDTLDRAGQIMTKASDAFTQVDNTRISS